MGTPRDALAGCAGALFRIGEEFAPARPFGRRARKRAGGAITCSSGDHALGVARAAQILGSTALIVIPDDAPAAEMEAVRSLGAEFVTLDRDRENYDEVVAPGAAALNGRFEIAGKTVATVVAGGNVDLARFRTPANRTIG